jgi:hypothetical protein
MTNVIQPNCRVQFAAEDIDFIVSILGRQLGARECLVGLLADQDSRDAILDDESLRRALLEAGGCLRVSTRLYFYVLIRHAFRQAGIADRAVADYVAEMLTEFARTDRSKCLTPGQEHASEYVFEMLAALRSADERNAFVIRTHIGNYSLFVSGVFPERIRFREEARGFPGLKYYEDMGRAQYRAASDHRLAQRYELGGIFAVLAEKFGTTRLALNDVADRLFAMGDGGNGLESLLKRQLN